MISDLLPTDAHGQPIRLAPSENLQKSGYATDFIGYIHFQMGLLQPQRELYPI